MNYKLLFYILPFPNEIISKIFNMVKRYKYKKVERIKQKIQIKEIKQNKLRQKFNYHYYYH